MTGNNFTHKLVQNYLDGKIATSGDLVSFITSYSSVHEDETSYKASESEPEVKAVTV